MMEMFGDDLEKTMTKEIPLLISIMLRPEDFTKKRLVKGNWKRIFCKLIIGHKLTSTYISDVEIDFECKRCNLKTKMIRNEER